MERRLVLIIGLSIASLVVSATDLDEWNAYKQTYLKQYRDEAEENFRLGVFNENKRKIDEHNELFDRGLVSFKKGINKYSDLTEDEFIAETELNTQASEFGGDDRDFFVGSHFHQYFHHHDDVETLPHSVDWRHKGAVTKVKNQGDCGASWAFPIIGAIEGQYFRKTGKLMSLSEQNLVDCVGNGNGCNGKDFDDAYEYVMKHGITSERSYPYVSGQTKSSGVCKHLPKKSYTMISNVKYIPEGDEHLLQEAIATIGPIVVGIDARELPFYSSGIYQSSKCSQNSTHGVLAVGYGTDKHGREYYICKNSWGKYWGENGYFRVARNQNNMCGIASRAAFPVI